MRKASYKRSSPWVMIGALIVLVAAFASEGNASAPAPPKPHLSVKPSGGVLTSLIPQSEISAIEEPVLAAFTILPVIDVAAFNIRLAAEGNASIDGSSTWRLPARTLERRSIEHSVTL